MDFQTVEFSLADGRKVAVLKGGAEGIVRHIPDQRLNGLQMTDAATQFPILIQGHEGSAFRLQGFFEICRIHHQRVSFPQSCADGLPGSLQQNSPLLFVQCVIS